MSLRRLVARREGKLCFLPPSEIDSVVADRNYLIIHARGQTYSTRWTMKRAEEALIHSSFVRIHRSTLLNLTHVSTIERQSPGRYLITLNNGQCFVSGRNYSRRMRALLSNAAHEAPAEAAGATPK